jgi:hypothetical protein
VPYIFGRFFEDPQRESLARRILKPDDEADQLRAQSLIDEAGRVDRAGTPPDG